MKYIRTKDERIIKIGEQTDTGYTKGTLEIHNKTGIAASYEPFEVLKEAGTIEELIDVYVCDELIFLSMEQLNHYCYIRNKDIYGAVWTSKGLIYVAKMDKNGELKLL